MVVDACERVATRDKISLALQLLQAGARRSSAEFHLLSLRLLANVISAANFLEANDVLKHACTVVAHRLAGHTSDELRRLLGAPDDLSAGQKAAAATESIYTPLQEGLSVATPSSSSAWAPPVARTVSSRFDNADSLAAALEECDAPTLHALKGVSASWRARAMSALGDPTSGWWQQHVHRTTQRARDWITAVEQKPSSGIRHAHFSAALIPEYDFPGLLPVFLRWLAGGSILNQWLFASSVDSIPWHARRGRGGLVTVAGFLAQSMPAGALIQCLPHLSERLDCVEGTLPHLGCMHVLTLASSLARVPAHFLAENSLVPSVLGHL